MVTSSYPRFSGDTVGTFLEPIARGLAARGHEIHLVLPWHPRLARGRVDDGVHVHPFRYAPSPSWHVFGYAEALEEDIRLRRSVWLVTPLALLRARIMTARVAHAVGATIVHGHWVVPGGVIAASSARDAAVVISLHGSDVYVAEHYGLARRAAGYAFRRAARVTACSDDLHRRALVLGAVPERTTTIPYGVDHGRFRPDPARRVEIRRRLGIAGDELVVFAAGRFVRKKGFEYLIEAFGRVTTGHQAGGLVPRRHLLIAGAGDLAAELKARAASIAGGQVRFVGLIAQHDMPGYLAAADLVVVPSVRDEAGNVDGLPNVVLEALATGAAIVATDAGGIPSVVEHERTGLLVPQRDVDRLAAAIGRLAGDPGLRRRLGEAARLAAINRHGWDRVVGEFEEVYRRARRGP